MTEAIGKWTTAVHEGDAFDLLDGLPENSVHAVVTDPPYGLAFMGRDWDDFEPREYQEWCEEWGREAKRVLRPGGHLLAFSGNRTHHRLFSGVEDAGFEIRDTLTWHYGSGFPKALDVSKAIDKAADREGNYGEPKSDAHAGWIKRGRMRGDGDENHDEWHRDWMNDEEQVEKKAREYLPATDAAKKWDGWKTGLKPATEYVVVARTPLSEGTVAENVQEWGTGALNIDGCRIDHDEETQKTTRGQHSCDRTMAGGDRWKGETEALSSPRPDGRYPANVVFDETEAEQLDADADDRLGNGGTWTTEQGETKNCYGERIANDPNEDIDYSFTEDGGPSRYFYTSKASKAERTLDGKIDNAHPTVKPQDLMEWLVRLVTREGQIVLDPFAGSGTTLAAAKELGREFIGFEQNAQWCDVARVRTGLTPADPATVRGDDEQQGLEAFADGGSIHEG